MTAPAYPPHPTERRLIVGCLLVMATLLAGCQHIGFAKSPLPVSVEPTASQYQYISYDYDDIKANLPPCRPYHGKSRPSPELCLPKPPPVSAAPSKPKRHFFLLENWF